MDFYYSPKLADALKSHIQSKGWEYDFDEAKGIMELHLKKDKNTELVSYEIRIDKEMFFITEYIKLPANIESEKVKDIRICLNKLNKASKYGDFSIFNIDNDIFCSWFIDCDEIGYREYGDRMPLEEIVSDIILRIDAVVEILRLNKTVDGEFI